MRHNVCSWWGDRLLTVKIEDTKSLKYNKELYVHMWLIFAVKYDDPFQQRVPAQM